MRIVGILAGCVVVAFLGVTGFALESGGVGIVESTRADGTPRRTHVWPARIDGTLWLEAGTVENGWYRDVLSDPEIWLEYEGARASFRAVPMANAAAHDRLRASIRERFGWRDRWVGIWLDSSQSVAVRLEPSP